MLSAALLAACGGEDKKDPSDAGDPPAIDSMAAPIDATNGVACPGTEANYSGSLDNPSSGDDGVTLDFLGDLDSTPDRLFIEVPTASAAPGTYTLPDPTWSVSICVNDQGDCLTRLPVFSGTMTVTSVEGRFKANLDRVLFVDNVDAPTCSTSVSQATIDVSILGPL